MKQNELNILNTHLDGLSSKYFMISNKEKDGIIEIRSKIIDIINEYKIQVKNLNKSFNNVLVLKISTKYCRG